MPYGILASFVGGIMMSVLKTIGWQKLVTKIAEDSLRLLAKKTNDEFAKSVATRFADSLEESETK